MEDGLEWEALRAERDDWEQRAKEAQARVQELEQANWFLLALPRAERDERLRPRTRDEAMAAAAATIAAALPGERRKPAKARRRSRGLQNAFADLGMLCGSPHVFIGAKVDRLPPLTEPEEPVRSELYTSWIRTMRGELRHRQLRKLTRYRRTLKRVQKTKAVKADERTSSE